MMLVTKYQISAINSYWEKCKSDGSKNATHNMVYLYDAWGSKNTTHNMVYLYDACDQNRFLPSTVTEKNATKNILEGRTEV